MSEKINKNKTDISTANSKITAAEGKIKTAEDNISSLQSDVSSLSGEIDSKISDAKQGTVSGTVETENGTAVLKITINWYVN